MLYCSILGTICLNIKRTAASKSKCSFPKCKEKKNLKTIKKEVRYRVAVEEKIYIPQQSVACENHIEAIEWIQVARSMEDHADFTKEYLENMFQLLSNPPKKLDEAKESSIYSIRFYFTPVSTN